MFHGFIEVKVKVTFHLRFLIFFFEYQFVTPNQQSDCYVLTMATIKSLQNKILCPEDQDKNNGILCLIFCLIFFVFHKRGISQGTPNDENVKFFKFK